VKRTNAKVLISFIIVLLFIPGASLSAGYVQAAGAVQGSESALTGVCYGPFRDGQNPNWAPYPSETNLRDDMPILTNMTSVIRTYGVSNGLDTIVPIANEFDLPVSPGAWLSSNREANENELAKLTTLAQTYELESVIVGSEVVLRYEKGWDTLNETELLAYLSRVKSNVSAPVTTGEPWHVWTAHPDLVDAVDFILIHVHPYWEGVPVEDAAQYVLDKYELIQVTYPQKQVVVGETGWPSEGLSQGGAVPGVANQERFMTDFLRLAREHGVSFYYFEAFDESWKSESNGVGPHWGFYHANRTAKHVIDSVLPAILQFDTGNGTYPTLNGTHTGTMTPNHDIVVKRLVTYPCPGTGGHSDYVTFGNESWSVTAQWRGYAQARDWQIITFNETFVLFKDETYNYTIRTGSYPQIHHIQTLATPDGVMTCDSFIDANGHRHSDWLPAIRLE